jgi:hypothetical protein
MRKLIKPKLARLAAVAASLVAISTPSAGQGSQRYLIEMRLSNGGQIFAQPRLEIISGNMAVIKLSDIRGQAYSIDITAKTESDSQVSFSSNIEINAPNAPPRRAQPALIVALNETATVAIGDASKGQKIFKMDVRFKPLG